MSINFLKRCDDYAFFAYKRQKENQQREMYQTRVHRTDDRIVSISQPHVRPIVRGKARAQTEFGAKVAVSMVDGYAFIDHLSWDPFNESLGFKQTVEDYKQQKGYYPEAILADKIYRTRENLSFCRERGIRLSGPPLGRPTIDSRQEKQTARQDMKERNAVEAGFGVKEGNSESGASASLENINCLTIGRNYCE
ncbi:hypothetical protein Pmgp_03200 [Pelotomaculum propionicicum]|jgi:hypothetical protein|uniref:Transposase DDE domain-containing protein n=1 Tax=Pelotomaculum propionicicum TaxID=258475 RepID=A0A4Y7RKW5_9FIRM|nr:hypothetical protein Pmgp_03200 [Pelotomaculum propionicicum]